jgi:hypothetical protein
MASNVTGQGGGTKDGTNTPAISLPKGGGAIKGIGETIMSHNVG